MFHAVVQASWISLLHGAEYIAPHCVLFCCKVFVERVGSCWIYADRWPRDYLNHSELCLCIHDAILQHVLYKSYNRRHPSRLIFVQTALQRRSHASIAQAVYTCMSDPSLRSYASNLTNRCTVLDDYHTLQSAIPPILLSTQSLASSIPRSVVTNMHSPGWVNPFT